ncbi:MAG TPA: DUF3667 domain-containing protein [Chitinophagaceae bacterium]
MNPTNENKRITVSSVLSEAWHSLTHVEEGLRRTIVALAVTPGKMMNSYLDGDRKTFQKPFSFLLIVTSLFAVMIYFFHEYYLIPFATTFQDKLLNKLVILESKYYSWLQIALLPVYALVSYLIFKKAKYNYAEWIVICCYVISFVLLLQIPFYILDSFLHFNKTTHQVIQLLITEVYTFYALNAFLKHRINWQRYIYILIGVVINFFIFVYTFWGIAYLMTT